MKTLRELLDTDTPAWPMVRGWIAGARNAVEILPASDPARSTALEHAQVTTRSPMGAIVYETGGLLIDHGWLRILGSGHTRMPRALMDWNRGRSIDAQGRALGFLLVADDVVGGFFAINGGALGQDTRNVHYFGPDSLRWQSLGFGYSDFVMFAVQGDLERFYANLRWPGWQSEIASLRGDQALSIYPPPWTAEGKDVAGASRRPVPVAEIWSFNTNAAAQLGTSG